MEPIKQSFESFTKTIAAWLNSMFKSNHHHPMAEEKQQLLHDIQLAKQQWHDARRRLDFLLEHDQIDQAIYAFEAAERRYNMLIKQAKTLQIDAFDDNEQEE